MTVKQLKVELEKYPDNMDVFLGERLTDFKYGLLESVRKEKISFSEDPDSKSLAKDEVIILDSSL